MILDDVVLTQIAVTVYLGTLTMAPDPNQGGALAPVQGAISKYMAGMEELKSPEMPDYILHEYSPFRDSSDLGPADWATLAQDIKVSCVKETINQMTMNSVDGQMEKAWLLTFCITCLYHLCLEKSNYLHFDGFVVLTGTDTMAYLATALSFMLENLGKVRIMYVIHGIFFRISIPPGPQPHQCFEANCVHRKSNPIV